MNMILTVRGPVTQIRHRTQTVSLPSRPAVTLIWISMRNMKLWVLYLVALWNSYWYLPFYTEWQKESLHAVLILPETSLNPADSPTLWSAQGQLERVLLSLWAPHGDYKIINIYSLVTNSSCLLWLKSNISPMWLYSPDIDINVFFCLFNAHT